MFVTALLVDKLVDESLAKADILALKYLGDFYLDWDDADAPASTAPKAVECIQKLVDMGVDPESLELYATGGKGFHCTVPRETFTEGKAPVTGLPYIFKELALEIAVDSLDLRVYSGRKGRMWREVNVQRPNKRYKVPVTWTELQNMTDEMYVQLTSAPRDMIPRKAAAYSVDFGVLFEKCKQKFTEQTKKRKTKPLTHLKSNMPSFTALCEGRGIKPGTGFHPLALQIGAMANAKGWTEDDTVAACAGLIATHVSDGGRYDTAEKRAAELRRMHRYTDDNPCYEVSIGAIKTLLTHQAPDLDGLPVDKELIEEAIANPKVEGAEVELDEFADVAGVTLNRYGVYINGENGPKRVCAVSFSAVDVLRSMDTGNLSCLEADILVNGRRTGRQVLELEVFAGLQSFNRFCAKLGHAFQGSDSHVRGMYMRAVEIAKKTGNELYVTSREGLDVLNIPNHADERLRTPFLVWADGHNVTLDPRVADTGVSIRFQGFPEAAGEYKIDIADAPNLLEYIKDPESKESMRQALHHMMACQPPEVMSKLLGWMVSCFYRMLFHRVYGKFPLLHINGAAGSGKTETTKALLSLFYYNQEAKTTSPSSSEFALTRMASTSTSIPLIIDEYKPHEMVPQRHDKIKLMLRDAYNCREQQKGGGTRDNDDYRALHSTVLSAPICFIAEAIEEESALLERVVLVTLSRPSEVQGARNREHYYRWLRGKQNLTILGQYIAAQTVKRYGMDQLRDEFDAIYAEAQAEFLLSEDDYKKGISADAIRTKQQAKERTVYNFTVAKFGLHKFRSLVEGIFGPEEFKSQFDEMEGAIYHRMEDLNMSTQAEWLKVFNSFSDMSMLDDNLPYKLRKNMDYAFIDYHGQECVELYVRSAYSRYRIFCKAMGQKPLYQGEQPFVHGLRDCPALITAQGGVELEAPGGSHIFTVETLIKMGWRSLKQ